MKYGNDVIALRQKLENKQRTGGAKLKRGHLTSAIRK